MRRLRVLVAAVLAAAGLAALAPAQATAKPATTKTVQHAPAQRVNPAGDWWW